MSPVWCDAVQEEQNGVAVVSRQKGGKRGKKVRANDNSICVQGKSCSRPVRVTSYQFAICTDVMHL